MASSAEDRYDAPRRRIPSGAAAVPRTPESPRSPAHDDVFRLPVYEAAGRRPAAAAPVSASAMQPGSPRRPPYHRKDSHASERRPSKGSLAGYSLYPAPAPKPPLTKPLPPLPLMARQASSRRVSSQASLDAGSDAGSGGDASRCSHVSSPRESSATLERVPTSGSCPPAAPALPPFPPAAAPRRPQDSSHVSLVPWKQLVSGDKPSKKDQSVYYFDISTTAATLASKHGNNVVKIWSVGSGEVQSSLKISCYTTAQPRSREYFVRSHAILSEPSNLIAVAAGFGDTLEIWDWGKKKRLQTLENASRWAAVRSNVMEAGWCPLVVYRADGDAIDLYTPTHDKKPFRRSRTIDLRAANLPVLPKFPELAFSATGPLLVAASGPRPPRLGHPPPERETLLVAWEIHDGAPPSTPYKVVAPWQHAELDTALPSGLATYGSVAVSIWIPASYRAVPIPADRGGGGFNLAPVPVPYRHVLVWDFAASSTTTFRIPNATSCVSPDCRFVAYCDARGVESGARGRLALLDAMTGRMLWSWPDPDAGPRDFEPDLSPSPSSPLSSASLSSSSSASPAAKSKSNKPSPPRGFAQLQDLSKITEMSFSADGGFLFVGDSDGGIGAFEVREGGPGGRLSLRAA